jgi:hypothetical protein
MSIKEQKLDLYKKYMLQYDMQHFIIRGFSAEDLAKESARLWRDFHSKITVVPSGYTLNLLKALVPNG